MANAGWPDLDSYLRELVEDGLTVLPFGLVGAIAPELADTPLRLLEATERLRADGRLQLEHVSGEVSILEVHDLREADLAFAAATRHPLLLALAELRLGPSFALASCTPIVRPTERRDVPAELHCDHPPQAPGVALSCIWVLTQHDRSRGSLCYAPGSHRLRRFPRQGEGIDEVVPVEAPAGSVIAFDGALWHGTWPRSLPGERLAVHCLYANSRSD